MLEPVRLPPSELKQKYGLSARLAARLGALLKRKMGVSQALLEKASAGSALEQLLLSSLLARASRKLSAARLNKEFHALGGKEKLAIRARDDWTVIALAEEPEAEEGWGAGPTDLMHGGAGTAPLLSRIPGLEDTSSLFTPEQIRQLKLMAVAGADVPGRRSAIRQLALSPAKPREKVAIFVNLLSDSEPGIRAEAVAALEMLGLQAPLAQTLRELAEGQPQPRLLAARRLVQFLQYGNPLEGYVIVRSLIGTLNREQEVAARAAMVDAFAAAAPILAIHPAECQEVLRLLVQQLREHPEGLRREVDRALHALAEPMAEFIVRELWQQAQAESEQKARVHIFGFLCQQPLPDDIQPAVVERTARQLGDLHSNDEQALRLGNLLVRHGDLAAQALLDTFPAIHPVQRTFFVELLDRITTEPGRGASHHTKKQVGALFLKLLQAAEATVRLAILEGNLCSDPELDPEIRRQLIPELFANLQNFHHPRTRALVETTVARMGLPVVQPLVEIIRSGTRWQERQVALHLLGKVFAQIKEGSPEVAEGSATAIAICKNIAETERVEIAAAALDALGDLCSSAPIPGETLGSASRWLRSSLRQARRPFELLRALGKICTNPGTPLGDRLDTVNLFLQLFRSDLPEVSARASESRSEVVFELGHEILAYTEMLPTLLQGFQAIALASDIPISLRDRIIEALCLKWRALLDGGEIWGPANATYLLETLRNIGIAKTCSPDQRQRVWRALATEAQNPSVVAALGEICFCAPDDPLLGPLSARFLESALTYWIDGERMERAETPRLLRSFANMISLPALGDDPGRAGRLRAGVLVLLYDALREKVKGMDDVLRSLAAAPGLPPEMRAEISDRLAGIYQLVKR